jgi:hypothetical protein
MLFDLGRDANETTDLATQRPEVTDRLVKIATE